MSAWKCPAAQPPVPGSTAWQPLLSQDGPPERVAPGTFVAPCVHVRVCVCVRVCTRACLSSLSALGFPPELRPHPHGAWGALPRRLCSLRPLPLPPGASDVGVPHSHPAHSLPVAPRSICPQVQGWNPAAPPSFLPPFWHCWGFLTGRPRAHAGTHSSGCPPQPSAVLPPGAPCDLSQVRSSMRRALCLA